MVLVGLERVIDLSRQYEVLFLIEREMVFGPEVVHDLS
jgi:hypothetical protein